MASFAVVVKTGLIHLRFFDQRGQRSGAVPTGGRARRPARQAAPDATDCRSAATPLAAETPHNAASSLPRRFQPRQQINRVSLK